MPKRRHERQNSRKRTGSRPRTPPALACCATCGDGRRKVTACAKAVHSSHAAGRSPRQIFPRAVAACRARPTRGVMTTPTCTSCAAAAAAYHGRLAFGATSSRASRRWSACLRSSSSMSSIQRYVCCELVDLFFGLLMSICRDPGIQRILHHDGRGVRSRLRGVLLPTRKDCAPPHSICTPDPQGREVSHVPVAHRVPVAAAEDSPQLLLAQRICPDGAVRLRYSSVPWDLDRCCV